MKGRIFFLIVVTMVYRAGGFIALAENYGQAAGIDNLDNKVKDYIEEITRNNSSIQGYIDYIGEGLKIARKQENKAFMRMLLTDIDERLAAAIEDISAIDPPEGLKEYHEMVRDSYIFHHLANQAILEQDHKSASIFYRKGIQAYEAAAEELKKLLTEKQSQ